MERLGHVSWKSSQERPEWREVWGVHTARHLSSASREGGGHLFCPLVLCPSNATETPDHGVFLSHSQEPDAGQRRGPRTWVTFKKIKTGARWVEERDNSMPSIATLFPWGRDTADSPRTLGTAPPPERRQCLLLGLFLGSRAPSTPPYLPRIT